MANATFSPAAASSAAPPALTPLKPLLPFLSDFHLALLLPPLAYWTLSAFYFVLDTFELLQDCRIHTPAETRQRNRVAPGLVVRTVLIQQTSQVLYGLMLGCFVGTVQYTGHEQADVAWWVAVVQQAREAAPLLLGVVGVDGLRLASKVEGLWPPHGRVAALTDASPLARSFDAAAAYAIYYYVVPVVRFAVAVLVADAWQYFWHRVMHSNKYLYRTAIRFSRLPRPLRPSTRPRQRLTRAAGTFHAQHHAFVVPYAFGAFYDTWAEGFLMDGIGTTLALALSDLTTRQAMWFNTLSTLKGVDDHGGYALPWNPLQWLGQQDAAFHDVHHQSWGIGVRLYLLSSAPPVSSAPFFVGHFRCARPARGLSTDSTGASSQTNYSQLYLTLWDHICGTVNRLPPEEQQRQYAKYQALAEKQDQESQGAHGT